MFLGRYLPISFYRTHQKRNLASRRKLEKSILLFDPQWPTPDSATFEGLLFQIQSFKNLSTVEFPKEFFDNATLAKAVFVGSRDHNNLA